MMKMAPQGDASPRIRNGMASGEPWLMGEVGARWESRRRGETGVTPIACASLNWVFRTRADQALALDRRTFQAFQ